VVSVWHGQNKWRLRRPGGFLSKFVWPDGYLRNSTLRAVGSHRLKEEEVDRNVMLPPKAQDEMLTRMRRIEGQARGVQRMISEDRDCLEILTQLASLRSAAYNASVALTKQFAVQCMRDAAGQDTPDGAVRDLVEVLLRAPH
jgi:DNA-binding FrmR family transcriptional regulator